MAIKVKNGQTILFIGDSITDCGRTGVARCPRQAIRLVSRGRAHERSLANQFPGIDEG